jgi:hypothetical protein
MPERVMLGPVLRRSGASVVFDACKKVSKPRRPVHIWRSYFVTLPHF